MDQAYLHQRWESNYQPRIRNTTVDRSRRFDWGDEGEIDHRAKKRSAYSNQLNVCTTLSALAVVKSIQDQSTLVVELATGKDRSTTHITVFAYGYLDYGIR